MAHAEGWGRAMHPTRDAVAGPMTCRLDGCPNESARGGLCWTHDWRKRNGKDLDADLRTRSPTRLDAIWNVLLDLADLKATDDDGWRKARARLKMALTRWAQTKRVRTK